MANATSKTLRDMADWFDAHPEYADRVDIEVKQWNWTSTPEMVVNALKALAPCKKTPQGGDYWVEKDFGGGKFQIYFGQAGICTKVSKGKRTVTKEVPDPNAPKVLVTEEVEDFEWVCPDSVLGLL